MVAAALAKPGLVSVRKTVQAPRTVARAGAPAMVPDMDKRVSRERRVGRRNGAAGRGGCAPRGSAVGAARSRGWRSVAGRLLVPVPPIQRSRPRPHCATVSAACLAGVGRACHRGLRAQFACEKHAATGRFFVFDPLPSSLLLQNTMNLLLLGALSLPVGYLGYGYLSLFVPPK